VSDDPVFLTVDDVLALHVDQIREFGGSDGVRDQGGLALLIEILPSPTLLRPSPAVSLLG
jgi:hypothetical protein